MPGRLSRHHVTPLNLPTDTANYSGLQVGASASRETETRSAVNAAYKGAMARLGGNAPSLVIAAFTCTHDASEVGAALDGLLPKNVPLAGMTTCRGVVCNGQWSTHRKEYALSVWALSDEEGGEFSVVHIPERGDDFQEVIR